MKNYLEVSERTVRAAEELIDRTFDQVAQRLGDNQYLFADRFTAADLTFACMAAAVVLPEQYGVRLPPLSELPEVTQKMVRKYRAHPAGQHALRMFATERHPRHPSYPGFAQ